MDNDKKIEKTVVFVVEIDRVTNEFEIRKKGLSGFEQSALEQYLITYCKALEQSRINQRSEEYLSEDEIDET